MQGRGAEAAPAHRDEEDAGRSQTVIALTDGAFDVWPGSHKLCFNTEPCEEGHYHIGGSFKEQLESQCKRVVFTCQPGDVLVFQGGHFVHGSPAIGGGDPTPRVVTYGTFWPTSTCKGQLHRQGKCKNPSCGFMLYAHSPGPAGIGIDESCGLMLNKDGPPVPDID